MERRKGEIIFEARVEYYDSNQRHLSREESSIEETVKRVVSEDLPREMETLFGINISVRVIGAREGSVSVFFGVLIAGIGGLSRYKALYDSITLIQEQGYSLINQALRNRDRYSISVSARHPSRESLEPAGLRWLRRHGPEPFTFDMGSANESGRRDGFFYFLLVVSILEMVAIFLLVYKAVLKTYF